MEKYDSIFEEQNKHYNINSFEQIGISDPFPSEPFLHKFTFPVRFDDFSYPIQKLTENESPKLIFIPSSKVMFKLMRACLDIYSEEYLWYK